MSSESKVEVGVPIKILQECEGHVVEIHSKFKDTFKGKLMKAEDNMNCELSDVTSSKRDGTTTKMESLFIGGNKIKLIVLPDGLKDAHIFKLMEGEIKKQGTGRGKSEILRAQGRGRGRGGSSASYSRPQYSNGRHTSSSYNGRSSSSYSSRPSTSYSRSSSSSRHGHGSSSGYGTYYDKGNGSYDKGNGSYDRENSSSSSRSSSSSYQPQRYWDR